MISNKKTAQYLSEIFQKKEIEDIILTPGSRNAPLIISFDNQNVFNTFSIIDERSAAFFGLGLAQAKQKPVALACTSGTAALNYAPAIAEAFHQGVPLIILTADRPTEWIHHGEGQAINQNQLYANYIKGSFNLPTEIISDDDSWYAQRQINQAINLSVNGKPGPVQINIPFREPIYNQEATPTHNIQLISEAKVKKSLPEDTWEDIVKIFSHSRKPMLVCGLLPPDTVLKKALIELAGKGLVVLTETTSNLIDTSFFNTIDTLITPFNEQQQKEFAPDLLIQIGHSIVSKRIKAWLRKVKPQENWQVNNFGFWEDTFASLSRYIEMHPRDFFVELNSRLEKLDSNNYLQLWKNWENTINLMHKRYLKQNLWSDLKVHQFVAESVPGNWHIQLANSTVVRYAQLFEQKTSIVFHSNRGVSGIEGTNSTAVGYAYGINQPTLLITGDISFFYDINAFWNKNLPTNLKIIVINNAGGDIFRYIPGPDSTRQLETFFATEQNRMAKDVADMFHLHYLSAKNLEELKNNWNKFIEKKNTPTILEIFTPKEQNALTLRNYFKFLSNITQKEYE